jgi:hypothetical protein
MNRPLGLILFLILATVFGCSKGDQPTYANVKGTVLYNGKPLDKGKIIFEIVGRPPSVMDIVGGEFNGQAMAGENKVSVSAKKKSGGSAADYDPTLVEYIPPEWGTESKQKRVVEAGQPNNFEFSIKAK